MQNLLIIAKLIDKSINFFLMAERLTNIKVDVVFFESGYDELIKTIDEKYTYIYIRDPYHADLADDLVAKTLEAAINSGSKLIDNLAAIQDIEFEDKWIEYQSLQPFMPKTWLYSDKKFEQGEHIIKKRISSQSKDIYFSEFDTSNNADYIVQEKLSIRQELRIFEIFGKLIEPAEIKQSKDINTKTTVIGVVDIPNSLRDFMIKVGAQHKFDFVGYDIAILDDGTYKLIELNRSCYFAAFYKLTGVNLAEVFLNKLT